MSESAGTALPSGLPTPFDAAEILGAITRLSRDLRNASVTLKEHEARFLVDAYYAMQHDRIRGAHQTRTLAKSDEPHDVLGWLTDQRAFLERQIARVLDAYSDSQPAGRWARSIVGIGPIIAAGLIANIDVRGRDEDGKPRTEPPWQAPTAGHIWRFAGLDPTRKWEKNSKRPWNASLKRLCWLIGESFTKVSGNENDIYGKVYKARKAYEAAKNEAGDYADQAVASLAEKKFRADTEARKHYEAGKLPPARLHLRAQRYSVKLFLSHLHHVMYELEFGEPPPKPYIISHGGHAHFVGPPNWPMQ